VLTPVQAAGQSLVAAVLRIEAPRVDDPTIPLRFNPAEYKLTKANTFAEIAIPGLGSPPIQFVRGGAETLALQFLLDTSDTLEDVRERYVNRLRGLLDIQEKLHAPPVVAFVWDRQIFRGVLESFDVTYTLFTERGVPLRAQASATLKEYRPVKIQVAETRQSSPTVEKAYTVRGETLSEVAGQVYRDPTLWRVIAQANDIRDPRRLEPGRVLTIPALR
jgi:nucleoid-associated protein YgaU